MSLAATVLSALLALPAPWYPPGKGECPEAREARLGVIAEAVALEAEQPPPGWPWSTSDLAWAVVAKTWAESGRYRLEVHDGRKRGDQGRSICLGQIMVGGPWSRDRAAWEALAGTDLESTRRCVRVVQVVLAHHAQRCRVGAEPSTRGMAAVFAGYGSGYSCDGRLPWAERRAAQWWRLRAPGR